MTGSTHHTLVYIQKRGTIFLGGLDGRLWLFACAVDRCARYRQKTLKNDRTIVQTLRSKLLSAATWALLKARQQGL